MHGNKDQPVAAGPKVPVTDRVKARAKKHAPAIVVLAVSAAYALTIGVGVFHDVFTRPEHTIAFQDALTVTAPAAVTFEAVREVWKSKK